MEPSGRRSATPRPLRSEVAGVDYGLALVIFDAECASRTARSLPNNLLLLIADAHHILSQQFLIVVDLVEERDRNVARVQDALSTPTVIQNRSTRQGPRGHDRPYLVQWVVDVAGKRGFGHYRARVEAQGIDPRSGEYIDDVNRRYDANRDTVAIAHHGEGCMRILIRQNLGGIK